MLALTLLSFMKYCFYSPSFEAIGTEALILTCWLFITMCEFLIFVVSWAGYEDSAQFDLHYDAEFREYFLNHTLSFKFKFVF